MKRLFQITFVLAILGVQNIGAQQLITQRDTIQGTVLETTMDTRISQLLKKREETCTQDQIPDKTITDVMGKNETESLSVAEVCRRMPRLSGFKIQVAVVHNRTEADKIRYEVRQSYPDLRTELDSSLRPNYRILAGSFFSRQSGQSDLSRVRKSYRDAVLVPYRIFCAESK